MPKVRCTCMHTVSPLIEPYTLRVFAQSPWKSSAWYAVSSAVVESVAGMHGNQPCWGYLRAPITWSYCVAVLRPALLTGPRASKEAKQDCMRYRYCDCIGAVPYDGRVPVLL